MPNGAEIVHKVKADYAEGQLTEIDGIRIDFPDWWFNLRVSNTEPLLRLVVEAATEDGLEERKKELIGKITAIPRHRPGRDPARRRPYVRPARAPAAGFLYCGGITSCQPG